MTRSRLWGKADLDSIAISVSPGNGKIKGCNIAKSRKRTKMDENSKNNRTIQYKRFKAKIKVVHNSEESIDTLHSMEILAEEHAKIGIKVKEKRMCLI
ncbi:hypothetical protein LIER_23874 [Lithospermum erythrorhizon]|uniref:Uncharacterized protein n=1 Tax=Lithospermum erythrorhizon TaxID=34254 RepID=A0AAV3R367_LITER